MSALWEQRQIGEVLKLEYGRPLDETHRKPDGKYPVYGANGEKDRTDRFYFDRPSIIVGRKGSAGEVKLTEPKFWPLDVAYFVTFDDRQYDLRFLFYLLTTLGLPSLARGVKPGINRNEVYSQVARFPTLSEQQRIVSILDEAFEAIATAKANAEKNLQNAQALFESQLEAIFSQRNEVWLDRHRPLADLCEFIVDCEHKTAPTQDEGIPLIRTPNIGKGNLLMDGVYRVSEETYRKWTRRAQPRTGDLILAREAPAGNVAVISQDVPVCLGQRTVLIRPKRDVFDSYFLASLILQPTIQGKLLAHSRGATVLHVNMKDIRALNVGPVPSLNEQQAIVSRISFLTEQTQRLRSVYEAKFAALQELKKSLLHQGFSGGL